MMDMQNLGIMCDNPIPESEIQNEFDPCSPGKHTESFKRKDLLVSNLNFYDLNPISCGYHSCEPGHEYGPKRRLYYLLHYIISGEGIFVSNGVEYKLGRGDIFVIHPNEKTFYKADKKNPWTYRWIGFTTSLNIKDTLSNDVIKAPECDYLFRQIVESDHIQNLREYYLCAKLYEIIVLIAQKGKVEKTKPLEYVMKAKNYIEINYSDNNLKVFMIADLLNIDRSYFSAIFKKHIKKSPQQYLLDFRLNKAAEMISFNTYSMSEIAYSCGYSDIFNFSKMFKKKFHVTPSQYGKMNQKIL